MKGKDHRFAVTERGELMELSPSQRKTIRHQFDSFCKKVLAGEAKRSQEKLLGENSDK